MQVFFNERGDFMPKMYSCTEVAARYGVQVRTVWGWIKKKKLPAMKIGRDYKINDDDIATFEESCRTAR